MKTLIMCVLSFLFINSCTKEDVNNKETLPNYEMEQVVENQREVGFQMLQKSFDAAENSLISPLSINMAMYMLRNGANTTTAAEMDDALQIDQVNHINSASKDLLKVFNKNEEGFKANLQNAVFYDPSKLNLSPAYKDSLNIYYGAEVEQLDFKEDRSVEVVNEWVAKATEDKIIKVLDDIKPEEVMFLLNALYLKADWDNGFPKERTSEQDFTNLDGSTSTIDFMNQDAHFTGFESDEINYLSMTLSDSSMVCKMIMPKDQPVSSYLEQLNAEQVKSLDEKAVNQRFMVSLPKIKVKYHKLLNPYLIDMGMTEAFTEQADLTGIGTSTGKLYVSRVLHDTYLEMDEAGIEGAAVTTVGVGVTSLPPQLTYDRPYIILIEDIKTGAPLFYGVVHTL